MAHPTRKLGKLAAKKHNPHLLSLTSKAIAQLPPVPDHTSWVKPGDTWPMFCNDQYGCCTATSKALITLHLSRVAQTPVIWPDADVLALYEATSGFRPDVPGSDQGAVMSDVDTYMVQHGQNIGLDTEVWTGSLPIDHSNLDDLARVIAAFGAIDMGWQITEGMENSTDGLWTFDPSSPIAGGHDAIGVDIRHVDGGLQFLVPTWTETFWADANCVTNCVDEAYLPLNKQHWCDGKGITPAGALFNDAIAYAQQLAAV